MLQRQRALRKQQQQTKQQSSKQLPPKGQTSANSRQARGQRTSTAKAQAANQQRVIARGMEGFVRRGQAMDKLDKAAKGTQGSGTRTAGAGGGIAKRQSSAVTTRQSGKPATTGGRVQPSTGGGASSNRVQPVRVRDLGTTKPNQMSGSTPRSLPPGRSGGALARTASGGGSAALRGVTKAGSGLLGKAAVPLAMAGEVNAMMDRNRRWNDYKERTGLNRPTAAQTGGTRRGAAAGTRTSTARPTQGNAQSRFAEARDRNIQRINNDPRFAAPKPASRPSGSGNTPPRPSSSSSGGGTTPQRTARTQAPAPRPSTGTTAPQPRTRQTDTNPIGRAQGNPSNFRQDLDTGIQAQKAPDYSKSRTSGTFVSGDNKTYGGTQPSKAPSSNKQRRATGRDEMILENLRRMRRRREQGNNN